MLSRMIEDKCDSMETQKFKLEAIKSKIKLSSLAEKKSLNFQTETWFIYVTFARIFTVKIGFLIKINRATVNCESQKINSFNFPKTDINTFNDHTNCP